MRYRTRRALVAATEILEQRTLLSAVFWSSASSGNWDDPTRWSTGQVPASGDDVTINTNVTVTVRTNVSAQTLHTTDGTLSIVTGGTLSLGNYANDPTLQTVIGGSLSLTGGTLQLVNEPGTLNGQFTWTSGQIGDQSNTLTDNGPAALMGDTDRSVSGSVVFAGQATQSGAGRLLIHNSTTVSIASTGTYRLQSDAGIGSAGDAGGGPPILNVAGTLEKTGGAGTSLVQNIALAIPGGTVAAQTGTLDFDTVSNSSGSVAVYGTFDAGASAVVTFTNDPNLSLGGGTLTGGTGSGHVVIDSTLNFSSASGQTGDVKLNFPGDMLQWNSGNIYAGSASGGVLNLGQFNITGTSERLFDGTLDNKGAVVQTSTGKLDGDRAGSGNAIINEVGATVELRSAAVNDTAHFDNFGLLRKTTDTGTYQFTSNYNSQAGGSTEADAGTLELTGGGSMTGGAFNAVSGATILFDNQNGAVFLSGTITGGGSGVVKFASPIDGGYNDQAAHLNFFQPGYLQVVGRAGGLPWANVVNDGYLTLTTDDLEENGAFSNTGHIIQSADSNLLIDAYYEFFNSGTYEIQGDTGVLTVNRGVGGGAGTFHNSGTLEKTVGTGTSSLDTANDSELPVVLDNTGAVIVTSGTLSLKGSATQAQGSTLSAGTWQVASGGAIAFPAGIAFTTNAGSVSIDGATSSFPAVSGLTSSSGSLTLTHGAALTTTGDFTNTGALTLGPASVLTVHGNYAQPAGTLTVQVAGSPVSGNFGMLSVTGTATLAGTFNADAVEGFAPASGQSYTVVSAGSISANFATVNHDLALTPNITSSFITLAGSGNPTDLAVTSVTAPATGVAGQAATFTYTVTNLSADQPATGAWQDSIYLSADATFDANDILVGRVTHTGPLAPGASYNGTLTAPIPAAAPGNYRVIVVTDSQSAVPDAGRDNNIRVSSTPIAVSLPMLTVGATASGTITAGENVYYSLFLSAGQIGGSGATDINLAAALGTAAGGQLFIKYGALPTTTDYDATVTQAAQPNQSIAFTARRAGVYYVLLHGLEGAGAAGTSYALTPTITTQGATYAYPNSASNAGTLSVAIHGSGFTPQMTGRLILSPNAYRGVPLDYIDASNLRASLNLTGIDPGVYELGLFVGANQVGTAGNITVTSSTTGGHLSFSITTASAFRVGSPGQVLITYTNDGTADIPSPLFEIYSRGVQFALQGNTTYVPNEIEVLGVARSGDAGTLAPGESGSVIVNFIQTSTVTTPVALVGGLYINPDGFRAGGTGSGGGGSTLSQISSPPHTESTFDAYVLFGTTPTNFTTEEAAFHPPGEPDAAWHATFTNFLSRVGGTVSSLTTLLDADATALSRQGIYTGDVSRLLSYEFAIDSDFGAIEQRNTLGSFGYGVVDPYAYSASVSASGDVTVRLFSQIQQFLKQSDGTFEYLGEGNYHLTTDSATGDYILTYPAGDKTAFKSNGQIDYTLDAAGNRTTYAYAGGHPSTITAANGDTTTLTYDAGGRITSATDAVGRVTTYTYDATDTLLTSIISPLGTTTFTYVASPTTVTQNAVASITNPDGTGIRYTYDAFGRVIQTSNLDGSNPVTFTYDAEDNYTTTNAAGGTTSVQRNEAGQVTSYIDALGNQTTYVYNDGNRLSSIIDPLGLLTGFTYDQNGNVTSTLNAAGATSTALYNATFAAPNLLTDSNGDTRTFTYNSQGKLTSTTDAAGAVTTLTYDSTGRLATSTTPSGKVTTYTYSGSNLLASEQLADGSTVTYGYDAHRNLVSSTDASGTTLFTYDSADRLTGVAYPTGLSLTYTYDPQGRRAAVTDNTGYSVHYAYDALSRLTALTDGGGNAITTYTYDALSRIAQQTDGNGTYTVYSYDAASHLTGIENHAADGSVTSSFAYTYDADGRRKSMTTADGTTLYGYDTLGRLLSVTLPNGQTLTYAYDAEGNRTSAVSAGGATTTYTLNNVNQITSASGVTYTYDADGNLLSDGVNTYTYDAQNRLVSISGAAGTTTYTYNAENYLLSTTVNGVTTLDLVDPLGVGATTALPDLVGQFSSPTTPVAQYAYGVALVSQSTGGSTNYYQLDAGANVTALTGAGGAVTAGYAYDPYGNVTTSTGPAAASNPFTYMGGAGVIAAGNNQYLARARLYDATTGRFTQSDPAGPLVVSNLYAYAHNDPVNTYDPSGYLGEPVSWIDTGAFVNPVRNALGDLLPQFNAANFGKFFDDDGNLFTRPEPTPQPQPLPEPIPEPAVPEPIPDPAPPITFADEADYQSFLAESEPADALAGISLSSAAAIGTGLAIVATPFLNDYINNGYAYNYEQSLLKQSNLSLDSANLRAHATGPISQALIDNLVQQGITPSDEFIKNALQLDAQYHASTSAEGRSSSDPNSITGPAGSGTAHYVPAAQPLAYEIDFENMATASAPAAVVTVSQTLDPNLDLTSFSLTGAGFGTTDLTIPAGSQNYSTRLTLSSGLLLDVSASLDYATHSVVWSFTTLDPATGDVPSDPSRGFLPPDNGSGSGTGYVRYTVSPSANLPTGAQISAAASIVFDNNAPLSTGTYVNTLDAGAPTSHASALPTNEPLTTFVVPATATDDAGGSGIGSYEFFVSDNGGAFTQFGSSTNPYILFTGTPGHTYGFFSVAVDNAGNSEPVKTAAEATTTVSDGSAPLAALVPDPSDPTKTALAIGGTAGDDKISVTIKKGAIYVAVGKIKSGPFSPTGSLLIDAGAGNDKIAINKSITLPAQISGGDGNDTVTAGGGASVINGGAGNDKLTGSAAGNSQLFGNSGDDQLTAKGSANFLSGGDGNDRLKGGGNADVLEGDAGNDALQSGKGREFLIGGTGNDTLKASGEDILIGSATSYDGAYANFTPLLAEWLRTDLPYASRIANLLNGGGNNGSSVFSATTVPDDTAPDTLQGGAGSQWFISGSGDVLKGYNAKLETKTAFA